MQRFLLIALLLARTLIDSLFAEDKPAFDPAQFAEFEVLLTDEAGKPIAGAEVKPLYLGTQHFGANRRWDYQNHGSPPIGVSNQDGLAVVKYPPEVWMGGVDLQPIDSVLCQVQHVNFVRKLVESEFDPENPNVRIKVTLKRGCEVRITAVNEQSQEPIQNFGVIVAGPCPADLWEDIEGGGRRSRAILEGHWQTLLVKPQTDGPTLFSGVLPLSTRRQRVTHLRNIWLSPGAVLRGRLSKNVPRPVTGYVVAAAFPRPAGKVYDVENPTLVWYDWVEIDRDGRFEFESLPGGGEVQLMAFCDGWIAVTDPEIAGAKHFEMGQLFPLDQPAVDVELKMEQTGTLQVELLAPDGTPLTEGEITSSPNQMFYLGAAGGILGQRIRSIDNIRNQFLTPGKRLEPEDYNLKLPFRKPVNPDGPTTLTGLPLNRPLKLFLIHKQLTLQSPARIGIFNVAPFKLETATPQQLKLQTIVHQPDP